MTLAEFANRIEEARTKTLSVGPAYKGRCPSCAAAGHDKDSGHLIVWEGRDEWLHIRCAKGCSEDQILGSMGLAQDDRRVKPYEPKTNDEKLPVYVYEQVGGGYAAEKHRRIDKATGKKYCLWKVRFKDGVPLEKIEQTIRNGPRKGETFLDYPTPDQAGLNGEVNVLYRYSDVRKAIDAGKTIYIGEGEPASETARQLGICHTCQRAGAGTGKWLPVYTAQLQGAKDLVIIADRDPEGESYAKEVYTLLRSAGFNVRVTRSKTTREHDDLRDHLEAGFAPSELIPADDLMPPRGLKTSPIESYVTEDLKFLFGTHLRCGQINVVDGDGAAGKTTFGLALAAAASNGYDPIARKSMEPFRTLYFGQEDSGGDLRYIYEQLGGKPGFLEVFSDPINLSPSNLALIRDTIMDGKFKMAIFDVLAYFLAGLVKDLNNAVDLMGPLANQRAVAMETGAGIVNFRHTGKGKNGVPASELGIGSVQIRNSHRSQLLIRSHPDRVNHRTTRVVTHEKPSLRVEAGQPFGWSFENGHFGWVDVDPEIFETEKDPTANKTDMAADWMVTNLTGNWMRTSRLAEEMDKLGVSMRTSMAARKKAGVQSSKDSNHEWWVTIIPKADPFAD